MEPHEEIRRLKGIFVEYIQAAASYLEDGSGPSEEDEYFAVVEKVEGVSPEKLSEFSVWLQARVAYGETLGSYSDDWLGGVRTEFDSRFSHLFQHLVYAD